MKNAQTFVLRGNVLYIHRCEVDVAENTVADTAPEPPETSTGASHSAPRPRSLANVFDARVTLVNNVLVNNSGFAYIINVGGVPLLPNGRHVGAPACVQRRHRTMTD